MSFREGSGLRHGTRIGSFYSTPGESIIIKKLDVATDAGWYV